MQVPRLCGFAAPLRMTAMDGAFWRRPTSCQIGRLSAGWNVIDLADNVIRESKRIKAEGMHIREQAIISQIKAGFTLCRAASQSIRLADFASAKRTVDRLAHSIERIHLHLEEPEHVPASSVPALYAELKKLEKELKGAEAEVRRNLSEE